MVFNVEFTIELGFLTLYHAFNFVKLTLEISITIRRHIVPHLHLYCFNLCRSFSLILFDMLRYICYDLCLSLFPLYFEFIFCPVLNLFNFFLCLSFVGLDAIFIEIIVTDVSSFQLSQELMMPRELRINPSNFIFHYINSINYRYSNIIPCLRLYVFKILDCIFSWF